MILRFKYFNKNFTLIVKFSQILFIGLIYVSRGNFDFEIL